MSTDNRANTAEICATFRDVSANNLEYQKYNLEYQKYMLDKLLTVKRTRRYDDDDDGDSDDENTLQPVARQMPKSGAAIHGNSEMVAGDTDNVMEEACTVPASERHAYCVGEDDRQTHAATGQPNEELKKNYKELEKKHEELEKKNEELEKKHEELELKYKELELKYKELEMNG